MNPLSIEKQLSPLLLKNVEFKLSSGKTLKKGVLKLINTKQFYIKLNIQQDKSIKLLELPYPYKISLNENIYTFDYTLSCLCQDNLELYYKLKSSPPKNHGKLYDTHLNILSE
jgi:hypothetical protein